LRSLLWRKAGKKDKNCFRLVSHKSLEFQRRTVSDLHNVFIFYYYILVVSVAQRFGSSSSFFGNKAKKEETRDDERKRPADV